MLEDEPERIVIAYKTTKSFLLPFTPALGKFHGLQIIQCWTSVNTHGAIFSCSWALILPPTLESQSRYLYYILSTRTNAAWSLVWSERPLNFNHPILTSSSFPHFPGNKKNPMGGPHSPTYPKIHCTPVMNHLFKKRTWWALQIKEWSRINGKILLGPVSFSPTSAVFDAFVNLTGAWIKTRLSSPTWHLWQMQWNSLQTSLIYHTHRNGMDLRSQRPWPLTTEVWPVHHWVQVNVCANFPQGIPDKSHSRERDGKLTLQQEVKHRLRLRGSSPHL